MNSLHVIIIVCIGSSSQEVEALFVKARNNHTLPLTNDCKDFQSQSKLREEDTIKCMGFLQQLHPLI